MARAMGVLTRRPLIDESPPKTSITYTPVTSLYTSNSIAIIRNSGGPLDGKINIVEISDGKINKTLTMTYDGSFRLTGFNTVVEHTPE